MTKALIVANWDWVIYNFRFDLARALRQNNWNVVVVSPPGDYVDKFESEGFRWVEWDVSRSGMNPLSEIRSLIELAAIYRKEAPDVVHHDTIKPNLYGGLAVQFNSLLTSCPAPSVLGSVMGKAFTFSEHRLASCLRLFVVPLYRYGMRRSDVVMTFSNQSDLETFVDYGIVNCGRAKLMVSEFVDTERFSPAVSNQTKDGQNVAGRMESQIVVMMGARLIWDKGVGEFVEAARLLLQHNAGVEFWLVGAPDKEVPHHVPVTQLREWDDAGIIRWLGHRSDMPDLLRRADIAVLPTAYKEGLPRFLVEAGASGLPLIATDLDACKRVVKDEVNGIIIPERSAESLAGAVERLVEAPRLRKEMGRESRRLVVERFSKEVNIGEWLDLYRSLGDCRERCPQDVRDTEMSE